MSAALIARSSLAMALARYRRSWGIWILLLIAPVGARLFIPRDDGTTIVISIADQLPVMTSAVIGVCLGVVVSTLLLPAAYIYLRANTNRRQPWQVVEVSPAARVPIAFGRYAADLAVLFGALASLNLAGIFLSWLVLPAGALDALSLSFALWVIAGPALMGLAAIRTLFEAVPLLRGALGDLAYFVIWIMTLAMPSASATTKTGLAANMTDPGGFVRPLIYGSGLVDPDFAIGGAAVKPGRLPVDAMAGLFSPGYLPSRLAWTGIALAVVLAAGLLYRPHRARSRPSLSERAGWLLRESAPSAADPNAPPAFMARSRVLALFASEFRLIGGGRPFKLLALTVAGAGLLTGNAPAALLLLAFALSAHAGRSEGFGLKVLTVTAPTNAWLRRGAFVLAGAGWSALLAFPHAVATLDPASFGVAAALGGIAASAAILLAALSGSAFAPRIVLLIAWYVYTAS
jgi:hypothetical protein